ncbi:MAG TPA: PIG-L family deacetylase [Armatimonadota bacterium]|nr:PIG-L family deacetylase [Armatimonadota bacterium]
MGHAEKLLRSLCATAEAPLPRSAIVLAHPDDEAVGLGSRLPRLRDALLIHVTDGSPRDLQDARAHGFSTREEYARARGEEVAVALELAGLPPGRRRELGCVDQEASLSLAELAREIAGVLREYRPEVVVTHPYEGGHPDHDATAFAVHAACRLLEADGVVPPEIVEATSYHNRGGSMAVFEFLPCPGCAPRTVVLSEPEREFKRRLVSCYRTQQGTLQWFPCEIERFRRAPRYEFTEPPHPGALYYELFPWGMTGERFRGLAGDALRRLELGGPL